MITVFIGTFNRLETLERSVKSYRHLTTPHELVIVDNGSDHPECIQLLVELEKSKAVKKVYSLPGCNSMEEATDNFNFAIRDQYDGTGRKWFAVSEADVCFDGTDSAALDVYLEVARKTGMSVGPHLRVDENIPACYPLRTRVLACEMWMMYRRDMHWLFDVPYNSCQIDTTFHLFPRTRFFNRLRMNPARVGPPWDAMHLDWYLNIHSPNRENAIYIPGLRPVGSWGKSWIRDYWFWFQDDPEKALALLLEEPRNPSDLCNVSFMLSWAFQYGHGCRADQELSEKFLFEAIPGGVDRYWSLKDDWMKMIYSNDFSSLGWKKRG